MAQHELPPPEDEHDEAILGDIERVGWSVVQIEPDDENDTEPVYSFSVGLFHTHGHAEILLLGLSPEVAGEIINDIGDAIASGMKIETGRTYDDFASVPVSFVEVDVENYEAFVGYAMWLYDGPNFPLLQCVWPLKSGLFPWDDGYPPESAEIQPLLDEPLFESEPSEGWPFEDPENVATMTVQQILDGGKPILFVSHDEEDGMWQFLTGEQVTTEHGRIVCLRDMLKIDSTIAELADLPLGWIAERTAVGEAWERAKKAPESI